MPKLSTFGLTAFMPFFVDITDFVLRSILFWRVRSILLSVFVFFTYNQFKNFLHISTIIKCGYNL